MGAATATDDAPRYNQSVQPIYSQSFSGITAAGGTVDATFTIPAALLSAALGVMLDANDNGADVEIGTPLGLQGWVTRETGAPADERKVTLKNNTLAALTARVVVFAFKI